MAEEQKIEDETKGIDSYNDQYDLKIANQKLKQSSKTIATLTKRLTDEMPDKPIFKHHCNECLYLGHTYSRSSSIHGDPQRFDLYLHRDGINGIFARYSNDDTAYLEDYEFDSLSEQQAYPCSPLLIGLHRAVNMIMSNVMSRVAKQPMDNLPEWYRVIDEEEEDE